MASIETLEKLKEHPEWIAPRSDVRVFLGEPGAPEATKTTVEPGNVFSPGMLTYGVTWWLRFPENGHLKKVTCRSSTVKPTPTVWTWSILCSRMEILWIFQKRYVPG
jgi:hypothetical protein